MRVFAVTDLCAGCGACIRTCPEKAIHPAPRGYPSPLVVLEDRCTGCAECAEVCPVAACVEVVKNGGEMRHVHPIETESYRIIRRLVDLSGLNPLSRVVAERIIHASADLDYADSLVLNESGLRGGLGALRRGAPIVADVGMVAAGITACEALCFVADPRAREISETSGMTRSAAGFRLAAKVVGSGAVWVVGNAPTALLELLELDVEPALVVGLPVGFVGAAESKEKLIKSGLPAVTNRGPKGGSAVAAAALNALLYLEEE